MNLNREPLLDCRQARAAWFAACPTALAWWTVGGDHGPPPHRLPLPCTLWHEALSWIRSTTRLPIVGEDFVDWWQQDIHSAHTAPRRGTYSVSMVGLEAAQCRRPMEHLSLPNLELKSLTMCSPTPTSFIDTIRIQGWGPSAGEGRGSAAVGLAVLLPALPWART